jgi:ABC-type nitrate/sulfonate/bicarbonate transport system permease component
MARMRGSQDLGLEGFPEVPLAAAPSRLMWPKRLGIGLVGPGVVVLAWLVASASSSVTASVLPPPHAVLTALADQLVSGALVVDIAASLGRSFLGYVVAAVVGIPLGLAMGVSPRVRAFLTAPVEMLRPVSSIAWIPLAILWFGIGLASVLFVTFIVCVFIVLLNTLAGVMDVEPDLVKAARTLGAGRAQIFQKVVVPSALPGILLGLRVALAGAWGGVVVTEMIASQNGVGYMIHHAQTTFHPALVIGGMLVIGVVGYLLNRVFLLVERRVAPFSA